MSSAVDWPRKTRDGRKIATAPYYESFIKVLDEPGQLHISFNVWKKLLSTTVNIAKFESFDTWALVHRCCRALLDHNDMNEFRMSAKIVKVGLQVAELTKDPVLAADIICNVGINGPEDVRFPSIPPSTYMQLITMCIETQHNQSAERILKHSIRNAIPISNLSKLYSVVLNGYAQCGDLQSTERMISEMKENGLEQRYVKYV